MREINLGPRIVKTDTEKYGYVPVEGADISKNGAQWLAQTLNPFSDSPLSIVGLCDEETVNTVTMAFRKTYQISAPAGQTGATYTAHVFTLPELYKTRIGGNAWDQSIIAGNLMEGIAATVGGVADVNYTASVFQPSQQAAGMPAQSQFGLFNIHIFKDNGNATVFPDGTSNFVAPDVVQVFGLDPDEERGEIRCIASAFETVNTTAEINKQGTVTSYRVPTRSREWNTCALNPVSNGVIVAGDGKSFVTNPFSANHIAYASMPTEPVQVINGPPCSVADALLYSDSKQWEAAKGTYTVDRYTDRNPLRQPDCRSLCVRHHEAVIDAGPNGFGPTGQENEPDCLFEANTLWSGTDVRCLTPASRRYHQFVPKDISGAIFTGLSSQTTITVSMIYIIEIAPRSSSSTWSNFVALAKPSPMRDARALDVYQKTAANLPVAVIQEMNSFGTFWKGMLGVVSKIASPVAAALSCIPEVGPAFATGLNLFGQASHLLSEYTGRSVQTPKPAVVSVPRIVKPKRSASSSSVRSVRTVHLVRNVPAKAKSKAMKKAKA